MLFWCSASFLIITKNLQILMLCDNQKCQLLMLGTWNLVLLGVLYPAWTLIEVILIVEFFGFSLVLVLGS
jgi:hypothetical protein